MNRVKFTLLSAGFVLAMALTFSCSSDDDGGGGGGNGGGDGGSVAYEGQTYKTVKIGTQTWFAENLNYAVEGSKCFGEGGGVLIGYDEDGNPITETLSPAEVQANCDTYGRLYDWVTVMGLPSSCNGEAFQPNSCLSQIQPKHRGICPSGWHIPSDDDFEVLVTVVGGENYIAIKATSGWNENGNGTDEFGFSALPGGFGSSGGLFGIVGYCGYWWSANEHYVSVSYEPLTLRYCEPARWYYNRKSSLFSVRCVKDN